MVLKSEVMFAELRLGSGIIGLKRLRKIGLCSTSCFSCGLFLTKDKLQAKASTFDFCENVVDASSLSLRQESFVSRAFVKEKHKSFSLSVCVNVAQGTQISLSATHRCDVNEC